MICYIFSLFFTAITAAGQTPLSSTQASAKIQCKALRTFTLPASTIALPTTGAYISSTRLVHDKRGEYCKVLGDIRPVDPTAANIRLEVNLPTHWNRKAVHYGGGTFDGWLGATNGLQQAPVGIRKQPGPLAQGFVTFGSDSGHHKHYRLLPDVVNTINGSFALNEEERLNFAHDALKKTHDVAVGIMQQRYGAAPERMFFLGSSTGGREAYMVMQRWPADYNGVLGAFAGWDQVEMDLQFIRVAQAMYAPGGFLPPSSTKLLTHAVLGACDALDGVKDGVIANLDACHFDPATLLCSAHARAGCLSRQQLLTVQTFASEQKTALPLANGVQTMPGYNVLSGVDLTGSMGLLHHPERKPKFVLNSFYYSIGDQVVRYFLAGDPEFPTLTLNAATGAPFTDTLRAQSEEFDASDTDLSRFNAHGGKLLILHGTDDPIIPTGSSVLYFQRLQATMGPAVTDSFVRFYLIPGLAHGNGVFNAGVDALGMLDHWLDTGTGPQSGITVDNHWFHHDRTRPLCAYPTWARYNGAGDINSSGSYTCVVETP